MRANGESERVSLAPFRAEICLAPSRIRQNMMEIERLLTFADHAAVAVARSVYSLPVPTPARESGEFPQIVRGKLSSLVFLYAVRSVRSEPDNICRRVVVALTLGFHHCNDFRPSTAFARSSPLRSPPLPTHWLLHELRRPLPPAAVGAVLPLKKGLHDFVARSGGQAPKSSD